MAFSEAGILLSQPIINDSRYDFIADVEGKLYKIQCKTSKANKNETAFTFSVSSHNWNGGQKRSYQDEVDFFFTSFNGINYLIPITDVGVSSKTLRLKASLNEATIAWAKDYEFSKILSNIGYNIPDFINQDTRDKNYLEVLEEKKEKVKKEKKWTNSCVDCGAGISPQATRCVKCYQKIQTENSINISREELKMKIRTLPFTSIGKEYGVTDNAIRKWCDKYNLPRKKSEIQNISDEDWDLI